MKQESMKILFFIRKSRLKKNGEAPIFLRVTINGQLDEVRIQRSIPLKLWDNVKERSKGKDRSSTELNSYIEALKVRLYQIHKELLCRKPLITPKNLLIKLFSKEERTGLSAEDRDNLYYESPYTILTESIKNLRLIDKDNGKGSEIAEIVLYGIMRYHYHALPVVPKIFYKQNPKDNAKGADSVHIVLRQPHKNISVIVTNL